MVRISTTRTIFLKEGALEYSTTSHLNKIYLSAATCATIIKTLALSFRPMVVNQLITETAVEMYARSLTDARKSGMMCKTTVTKVLHMALGPW